MKKFTVCFVVFLMSATATFAADDEHEQDRVRETGTVLKEILNMPDDIPRRQLWPRRDGVPERRTLQG